MKARKILVLFAHPRPDRSEANARLAAEIRELAGVTFVDLYARYPTFEIDVAREQQALLDHDVVVFQHPFYWYSTPAILKEWQDLVLEHGFAYGSEGTALKGKLFLSAITTGGAMAAYCAEGYQRHSVRELLMPIEQTAVLCNMIYLPPLVLFAAGHALEEGRLTPHAGDYARLLCALRDHCFDLDAARQLPTLYGQLDALIREKR